eukprot:s1524_g18.t1
MTCIGKVGPTSTAVAAWYDRYEKEITIRQKSDTYQTCNSIDSTDFHHLPQHFCRQLRLPGLPSVAQRAFRVAHAMRDRRGSFDDAFSPMVSMPSVVDLDSGTRLEKDLLGSKEPRKHRETSGRKSETDLGMGRSCARQALPDLNRELQIPVGTAGLQPQAPDRSGHCRTSTASPRSQWALPDFNRPTEWALPDLNRELQIAVGTAGLQPVYEVPKTAYYGIQTMRALECYNITGIRLRNFPEFIVAFAMVKTLGTNTCSIM